VVYTDYSGERPMRYLTNKMTFVNDKLSMVLKENAAECRHCGRTFSTESLINGRCRLCDGIENPAAANIEKAKKLYARYRNAFSHTVRMKHLFDNKYCMEDETALVFALGNETYVLKKIDLENPKGYLKQPEKVR
ncbi:MAG: hypothetical protein K2N50_02920, partial [Clostridia bacterium]|nr:hypothetical protein [Clostridia bacterium]